MMTNNVISADKRLLRKIQARLAMISMHSKVREGARTEPVNLAGEGPTLPFLYQG
jgi:hypothetical protein